MKALSSDVGIRSSAPFSRRVLVNSAVAAVTDPR